MPGATHSHHARTCAPQVYMGLGPEEEAALVGQLAEALRQLGAREQEVVVLQVCAGARIGAAAHAPGGS